MFYQCTICQENLTNDTIAAVKCGHTFHSRCISEWFNHSKTCPTCRFKIKSWNNDVVQNVFFDKFDDSANVSATNSEDGNVETLNKLKQKCNILECQLTDAKKELVEKQSELRNFQQAKQKLLDRNSVLCQKLAEAEDSAKALRYKCNEYDDIKNENKKLKATCHRLNHLQRVNSILNGTVEDTEWSLVNFDSLEDAKKLILSIKKQCDGFFKQSNKNAEDLRKTEKLLSAAKKENADLLDKIGKLKKEIILMRSSPNQTPFNRDLKDLLTETPDTPLTEAASTKLSTDSSSTPSLAINNDSKKRTRNALAAKFDSNLNSSSLKSIEQSKESTEKDNDDFDLFCGIGFSVPKKLKREEGHKIRYKGLGGSEVRSWSSQSSLPKTPSYVDFPRKLSFKRSTSNPNPFSVNQQTTKKTTKITDFNKRSEQTRSKNDSIILLSSPEK